MSKDEAFEMPGYPIGMNVMIELDDDEGEYPSGQVGYVRAIGFGVPAYYFGPPETADKKQECRLEEAFGHLRGLQVGCKVLLAKDIDEWREIPPDTKNPERPSICVVDVKYIQMVIRS
jgi:hypothetical protein